MRTKAKQGFTLIELLVVIAIVGILIAILMPTLRRVLSSARGVTTAGRINALSAGCLAYKQEFGFYPGQNDTDSPLITGGKASNFLARAMWTKKDGAFPPPASNYCDYSPGMFLGNDTNNGIGDGAASPRAILYFPSHIEKPAIDQFVRNDNDSYCDITNGEKNGPNFAKWINNPENPNDATGLNALTKKHNGAFLLVGAGTDGKYFTKDDFINN